MSRCEVVLKAWGHVKERGKRMHAVFEKAFRKHKDKVITANPNELDGEFVVEELRALRETMGRWRRDTLNTTKDILFQS